MLLFTPPWAPPSAPELAFYARHDSRAWGLTDLEAITRDPASGRLWTAYEQVNRILRVDADYRHPILVSPPAMRNWRADFGPESMVRLSDGRFIVLAERSPRWFDRTTPGLLFAGDPAAGAMPQGFRVASPPGYSPSDMAQLPDGRVLVLMRAFELGLPPRFPCLIALADPADIRPGATWRPTVIAPPRPAAAERQLRRSRGRARCRRRRDAVVDLGRQQDALPAHAAAQAALWPANEKARGASRAPQRISSRRRSGGRRRPSSARA